MPPLIHHPPVGLPPTIHTDPSLLLPAVSEALLELRLLWRLDAFWHGGGISLRHILLPPPRAGAFDLPCGLGFSSTQISPLSPTLLSLSPSLGNIFQVHFGTVELKSWPHQSIKCGGVSGKGSWVMRKGRRPGTWGRRDPGGRDFRAPAFPLQLP